MLRTIFASVISQPKLHLKDKQYMHTIITTGKSYFAISALITEPPSDLHERAGIR